MLRRDPDASDLLSEPPHMPVRVKIEKKLALGGLERRRAMGVVRNWADGARPCPARDDFSLPGQSSFLTAAWPLMAGYGELIRPAHSTLLNRAGGTWSAWEKLKPAVTMVQYAALCLGLMFGPAANFTPPSACDC